MNPVWTLMLMLMLFAMLLARLVDIKRLCLYLRLHLCLLVLDVRNQPSCFKFCERGNWFAVVTGCPNQGQQITSSRSR